MFSESRKGSSMIDNYRFGEITIDGTLYDGDVKIIGDRVVPDWWRVEGHRLLLPDIEDVLKAHPEVLIVGQGDPGRMEIAGEVRDRLDELGIELIALPTRQAVEAYNRMSEEREAAFAAHLTC
jgi:hypothetical protein